MQAAIMKRIGRSILTVLSALTANTPGHTAAQEKSAAPRCSLTAFEEVQAVAVRDGRTLVLTDGREVRLWGIETFPAARAGLQRLAGDKTLRLEWFAVAPGSDAHTDRYGRLVAFAVLSDSGQMLQQALLSEGAALVSVRIGNKSCAETLLAVEREAREARRGLWADPNFAPLAAENLPQLAAARGHFALVEGRVLSVRESGATIYVNFGRRWTRDFTVTVSKRQRRTFAAAGIDLGKLEGRHIRVRGFIEQRSGPIVEATAPEQIELIE
ncbi:MAG TPA: thermonuclease family protein [Pseudolabrys sp.]